MVSYLTTGVITPSQFFTLQKDSTHLFVIFYGNRKKEMKLKVYWKVFVLPRVAELLIHKCLFASSRGHPHWFQYITSNEQEKNQQCEGL